MTEAATAVSDKQENRIYWPEIDGLRAIAFLLVFIHHFNENHLQKLSGLPKAILEQIGLWGWTGVDLFFVISGFLITSLLLREREDFGTVKYRHFLMRRVLRIWPLYFFALLLGFVILPLTGHPAFLWGNQYWQFMVDKYALAYAFFIGNFAMAVNPHVLSPLVRILWSVCIEEQFYVFWGGALKVLKRPLWLALLSFSLLGTGFIARSILYWINPESHHLYYYVTLSHLDPLLIGILMGLALFYGPEWGKNVSNKSPMIPYLIFGLAVVILWGIFSNPVGIYENEPSMIDNFFWIALGWGAFLYSVMHVHFLKAIFQNKLLIHLGKISYGLYVFHNVGILLSNNKSVQAVLNQTGSAGYFLSMIIALTTVYTCAFASWHLLEKPFLRKKEHFARILSKTKPS